MVNAATTPQQSQVQTPPQQQAAPQVPPLSDKQKQDWNSFLDFIDKEGFKGNPVLDDKDKQLGLYLMQKYRSQNPKATITYQDVPRVQAELQQYRNGVVNQWKAGKIQTDAKSEDEIMPNLSKIDGWLGSKTSSYKFPTANLNNNGKVINYGTDIKSYDAAMGKLK